MTVCTFIVSAFNRPTDLKLCLLSLVLQSRTDWSAIVTDNANSSTHRDLNEEAVRWVGDDRISYLYTGDRANNCYWSANLGAVEATGTWICTPSDDSYYSPRFLERMLRGTADDLDLIYCDMAWGGPALPYRILDVQPRCCEIDKTGFLVRREWFQKVGGFGQANEALPSVADGELVEKLVAAGARHGKVAELLATHN